MSIRTTFVLVVLALVVGMQTGAYLARAHDPACQEVQVVQLREPRLPVRIPVAVTAYNALPAQTDSTPDVGAWGDNLWALRAKGLVVVAISRDLEELLPPGTLLIVADRMAASKRKQLDVHFVSRNQALRWGLRQGQVLIR